MVQIKWTLQAKEDLKDIAYKNCDTIPDGLQGAGNKAWTFIDEIVIE